MKPVMATFLLLSLVLMSSLLQTTMADSSVAAAPEGFCTPKCAVRCSKAGRQDRCLKYCMICCEECSCVPSGTSGNKDECPCYRDKKNSKGTSKCP